MYKNIRTNNIRDDPHQLTDIWCFSHRCTYIFNWSLALTRVCLVLSESFQVWSRQKRGKRMYEERCHFGEISRGTARQSGPKIVPTTEQWSDCSRQIRKPPRYFGIFPQLLYFPSNLSAPPYKKPILSILLATLVLLRQVEFWDLSFCKGDGFILLIEKNNLNPSLFLLNHIMCISFSSSMIPCIMIEQSTVNLG